MVKGLCEVLTCTLSFKRVPHVAVEVIVASEQQTATLGEGHGGDAADNVVVRVHHEFLVRTKVKQTTSRVVRTRGERITIWKELKKRAQLKLDDMNICTILNKYYESVAQAQ